MKITKFLFIAALLLGSAALAQKTTQKAGEKPTPKAEAKPVKKATGDVRLKSKGADYDGEKDVSRLTGDVIVRQDGEDFVLYADNAIYDHANKRAVASGNLRVETRDSTITGLNLRADFNAKRIVITGNVVSRSHGKDDGSKELKKGAARGPGDSVKDLAHKPSNITCDKIEFNYELREALVTGNIKIKQGESNGTCKQIFFDEENNVAELQNEVIFTDRKGQTFKCDLMKVWFDVNHIEIKGPFELISPRRDDEEPAGDKPPKRDLGKPSAIDDKDLRLDEPKEAKAP